MGEPRNLAEEWYGKEALKRAAKIPESEKPKYDKIDLYAPVVVLPLVMGTIGYAVGNWKGALVGGLVGLLFGWNENIHMHERMMGLEETDGGEPPIEGM